MASYLLFGLSGQMEDEDGECTDYHARCDQLHRIEEALSFKVYAEHRLLVGF